MMPSGRRYRGVERLSRGESARLRRSAVLIALVPAHGTVYFPLIERSDDGGVHAGQIALPGGGVEAGDADPAATALREAREEINLPTERFTVIGELTPLVVDVSGYLIHPVVAWFAGDDGEAEAWSAMRPHPAEVREVLRGDACDMAASRTSRAVSVRGDEITVPCYLAAGRPVWGATAMILSEFFAVVARGMKNPPFEPLAKRNVERGSIC